MDPHPAGCSSRARMRKGSFCGRGRSSTAALFRQKRRDRIDRGGQGDEADAGGGWERDSPGALHLPGRPEVNLAQETLERVRVPRGRGRPRKGPRKLVADKAYDCDRFRGWLRRKGMISCIPPRRSRKGRRKRWADEFKGRWWVERTFARLGNFRRPMVRWERLAMMYEAFCILACIIVCLRELLK